MARKRCCGIIEQIPGCRRFLPDSPPAGRINVLLEEIEAIRLKDIAGLDQAECAAAMGVSRATFQRILQAARVKVATALIGGYQIIFNGGNYQMRNRVFECVDCGENMGRTTLHSRRETRL